VESQAARESRERERRGAVSQQQAGAQAWAIAEVVT